MLYHKDIAMYPRTTAVDIGAFTGDYLMFRYGEVDMEFCDSMEMGIISLYNRVITGIRADYDQLLDEMDIDSIIRGKYDFYEGKIVQAVLGEVQAYARDLLSSLRDERDRSSVYIHDLSGWWFHSSETIFRTNRYVKSVSVYRGYPCQCERL